MKKKVIQDSEAKEIMLSILIKFAEYCEKYNLRYVLGAGTLLGAIRHKGYIPWDNDIDVWMPRPDYEKFIFLTKQNPVSENINCLDFHEVRTFPFIKLADKRTVLKENYLRTEQFLGIYIDIFPLDGISSNKKEQKKILKKVKIYNLLFNFANYRFNTGSSLKIKILKNILYPFSKLISNKWVCLHYNNLCKNYNYDDCEFCAVIVWGIGEKTIFKRKYFDISYAEFEKSKFKVPKYYDEVLKIQYGNYMKLPPENERIAHSYIAYWK